MEKKNKTLLITSVLCLLPIILAAALYDRLPDSIAIHFDVTGAPDSYLPKAVVLFALPALLAAINAYIHFRVNKDPKNENASSILKHVSKWAAPLVSVIMIPVTMFIAMGAKIPVVMIGGAVAGVFITLCGNYLPKCRRNYTVGIKLPWTLDSEDNWNRTHRFAGFVWVAGGIIFTASSFLPTLYIPLVIIALLITLPIVYSYIAYKRAHG